MPALDVLSFQISMADLKLFATKYVRRMCNIKIPGVERVLASKYRDTAEVRCN